MSDLQTPAQARMAHARASRGNGAQPTAPDRYEALRKAQAKSDKVAAARRANMQAKGIILPDDSEEPFDPNPAVLPEGHVRVRVLKRGDNRISMGLSLPLETDKFPNFRAGDVFVMPKEQADLYELDDRFGWVETVD